ncbi:MAG: flippase-like domain-containing protein [Actinomycetota bacterium]|nr:flippase-like domain-containing protein [Actinomycetota bacterium]
MGGVPVDGEVIEKSRLRRDLAIAGVAVLALGVIVALNFREVVDGLSQITFAEAFGLVSLHLLALVCRAMAWGLCLDAAGSRVPPRELHATSGPRFLADTVVPTYVGAWVRIGLLKMFMGTRAPTIGQMISADGVILLVEGGITVVVVVALTFAVGLPWWWSATVIGLAGAGALLALWLKERYTDRPFIRTLNVLSGRHTLGVLTGLLTIVLVVQPVRFWIVINGVGIDADFVEAVLAFLATSVIGGLPVGPGPASVGATGVVFSGEELGLIAASGIGLTATAFVAALIYSLAGLAIAGPAARESLARRARRETPSAPEGAGSPR